MKKQLFLEIIILLSLSVIVGFFFSYLTKQGFFESAKEKTPNEKFQLISLAEAKEAFFAGGAVFLDARHEFEYTAGHIRGALNIPLHNFDRYQSQLSEIPKDALLVVYCDGVQCNSSIELALKLSELDFKNIKVFFGGWDEWKTAGLPTTP